MLLLLKPSASRADEVCGEHGCHAVLKQGQPAPFDGVLLNRAKMDGVTTELSRCLDKLRLEKTFLQSVQTAEQEACTTSLMEATAAHSREANALRGERDAAQRSVLPLALGAALGGLLAGGIVVAGIAALAWPEGR